jgi:MFS family permease
VTSPPQRARFRPDLIGAALFCITIVSLLYALATGGFRHGWTSPTLLALLGVSGLGLVLFVQWERRAADPVIPLELIAVPAVARADAVVLCFAASLFGTVLYWPLYLQLGRGVPIGESGLYLLPITLSMVLTSAAVGRLIARTGTVTLFPQVGLAASSLLFLMLAIAVKSADTWIVVGLTVLVGAGLGMVMPSVQVLVQNAAGRERLGAATASISLSRSMGGALGAAIAGAILLAVIAENESSFDAVLRQVFAGDQQRIGALSVAERSLLDRHLNDAYRILFVVLSVISACGAAIAFRIPKPDWTTRQAPRGDVSAKG